MVSQTILCGTLPLGMPVPGGKSPLPHTCLGFTVEKLLCCLQTFRFSLAVWWWQRALAICSCHCSQEWCWVFRGSTRLWRWQEPHQHALSSSCQLSQQQVMPLRMRISLISVPGALDRLWVKMPGCVCTNFSTITFLAAYWLLPHRGLFVSITKDSLFIIGNRK